MSWSLQGRCSVGSKAGRTGPELMGTKWSRKSKVKSLKCQTQGETRVEAVEWLTETSQVCSPPHPSLLWASFPSSWHYEHGNKWKHKCRQSWCPPIRCKPSEAGELSAFSSSLQRSHLIRRILDFDVIGGFSKLVPSKTAKKSSWEPIWGKIYIFYKLVIPRKLLGMLYVWAHSIHLLFPTTWF